MYPVFESIRIRQGLADNLSGHIARMERTAWALWGEPINYGHLLDSLGELPLEGLHKCRVEYFREELRVNIQPYTIQALTRLYLVEESNLLYQFKWSDRSAFDYYRRQITPQEDVLFVQNGLLTDSLYANIILWNGQEWHTPAKPLLMGTQRKRLLDEGILLPKSISVSDLVNYSRISLINALLDPDDRSIGADQLADGTFLRRKS